MNETETKRKLARDKLDKMYLTFIDYNFDIYTELIAAV